MIREAFQKQGIIHHIEQTIQTHFIKELYTVIDIFSHCHCCSCAPEGKTQVGNIRHLITDTDPDPALRHFSCRPVREGLHDICALFRLHVVHDDHKISVVIEKMTIVGQVGQVELHPVGDPLALHSVHGIQVAGGDQSSLKGSVQIKVRKELLLVQISGSRTFNGPDQSSGNLLVRRRLQEDPDTHILDHIRQIYFPWYREQRQVVMVAQAPYLLRDLPDVISRVDDQTCRIVPGQLPHQIQHLLLCLKAQPGRDRQLFAAEILNDRQILQHQKPADGIRPPLLSRLQLHMVFIRRDNQHVLYCKSHVSTFRSIRSNLCAQSTKKISHILYISP